MTLITVGIAHLLTGLIYETGPEQFSKPHIGLLRRSGYWKRGYLDGSNDWQLGHQGIKCDAYAPLDVQLLNASLHTLHGQCWWIAAVDEDMRACMSVTPTGTCTA